MKIISLVLLLTSIAVTNAYCQKNASITFTNQSAQKYELASVQKIDFSGQNLRIHIGGKIEHKSMMEIAKIDFFSKIITGNVIENVIVGNLVLYPNPVIDKLFVQFNGANIAEITLTDLQGTEWLHKQISNESVLEVNELPLGLYICKLIINNNTYYIKIVK